jgi:adenine-specific DNA-methyltransferase
MKDNFSKLTDLLRELFQLDQADLDFGIYRIMNARRDDINRFLEQDLLPQVREAFSEYKSADKALLKKELDEAIDRAKALEIDPNTAPKVKELREKYEASSVDVAGLENEVYDHLYSFFKRYYDEGDFISLRRYKEGVYAIPYEGEEVKLYWANHDQYYIKTTENFRDYAFKLTDGSHVHFKIIEADTEKDNIKSTNGKDRRFCLVEENPVAEENGELVIRFEYQPDEQKRKQDQLNTETVHRVMELLKTEGLEAWEPRLTAKWKRADGTTTERTILEKHLSDYTRRNTFDYFIHKNLDEFLRLELDFYIKNEVMRLDDVESESAPRVEQYLSKIKVIRKIAHKIIDFLAQIEDFQKKLWLKKKFVVETNYCITLDRIPEVLYPEIASNEAQREEWVRLFAIDEIKGDMVTPAYSVPLTIDFLKANPFLVLDTGLFDASFKVRLLKTMDYIDERCDGLLINSENFQALNLLTEKYNGNVKCTYIDPPFNTDATPILYKNEYQDSSWLSLMRDRLMLGQALTISGESFVSIAIDDKELAYLSNLLTSMFPMLEIHRAIVVHYPGSGTGRSNVTRTHEYNLFLIPKGKDVLKGARKGDGLRERGFRRSGTGENNYRVGRPNSFFAVLVDPNTCEIRGFEPPPQRDDNNYPREDTEEGYKRIYPIGEDGSERCWSLSYVTAPSALKNGLLKCTEGMIIKRLIYDDNRRGLLKSVWKDSKYNAVSYGTNLLTDMFGTSGLFSYPKSLYTVATAVDAGTYEDDDCIVLDYFAGSGTTGHAVINLNREDGGARKYILVEMGQYFDTVMKVRLQKVIYSKDWKDGKPVSRNTGISHMFKYLRLESYEDALANIQLTRTGAQQELLESSAPFRESYVLKYMLDTESKGNPSLLNIDRFEDPFSYQLLVGTGSVGETKAVNADLVETFNWLLGLRVQRMKSVQEYLLVEGTNPKGEKVLVIWRKIRDLDETDPAKIAEARKKANDDLDSFFQEQHYNKAGSQLDIIYVNGDNNLMNVPVIPDGGEPTYQVRLIEEEFKRLMFDMKDV